MLFAVQPETMNGTETVLKALDAIASRVEDDVHELEIVWADELDTSAWYRSCRPDRQKLLEEVAETSLYRTPRTRGPHLRRIDVSGETAAKRAQKLACAPLRVLLENDISDAALVKSALLMFAAPTTKELCFGAPSKLEPPAFEMESRGGHGELKKLIINRLAVAADRDRLHRLIVVTDSDGERPGEVKEHAQGIRDLCAAEGIPCPPLNKRTAENYIPDVVWQAWAAVPEHKGATSAVEALLRLSPEQRDCVHLDHTNVSPWDSKKPDVDALFKSVSPADRDLLCKANLKGRGDKMVILALRDHASSLTPIDLQLRDQHGDLLSLVHQIEDEL